MTRQKQLKALVRSRMEKTGESYMVARRHVLNSRPPTEYVLRGGVHPETAACANAFGNRGLDDPTTGRPVTEALMLGIGGGLGAGYILWQFEEGDRRVVTTGFRNQWQYPQRWYARVAERLGVDVEILETGGERKAAAQLNAALDEGTPVVVFVSAADLPYWGLSAEESGWWGYPIVVYGREEERYLVDDRNGARLSVAAEDLARARARIPSYENRLVVMDPAATELEADTLTAGVLAGLGDQIEHLSAGSSSFSIPAFAKWAKMLVSTTDAKGWPQVFADQRGLLGALVSTVESVDEVGILGGNLRDLYADFLGEAGRILGTDLADPAAAYRAAARAWADLGEVCRRVPAVGAVVEADRERRRAVEAGDRGLEEAARWARRANELLAAGQPGLGGVEMLELFAEMSAAVEAAVQAERQALELLRASVPGS